VCYIAYWLAVIATLVGMKFKEGRMALFGRKSTVYQERYAGRAQSASPSLPQ
jgi:hypothetical protein